MTLNGNPTRRIKNPLTGEFIEAPVAEIEKAINEPIMIHLVDGAVIRFKVDIVEVLRIPGAVDNEGNPVYYVKSGNVMSVLQGPTDSGA